MPTGVYPRTEYHRQIAIKNLGDRKYLRTEKHKKQAIKNLGKFIGDTPWNKGKKGVQIGWNKGKVGWTNKGSFVREHVGYKAMLGKIQSLKTREKISLSLTGIPSKSKGRKNPKISGPNHWKWQGGYSRSQHKGIEYDTWRMSVYTRDNFRCKMSNEDCEGKIEAHHILGFTKFPELRYEINNGITLCHAHHPKKRAEELLFVPKFKELIAREV